MTSTLTLEGRDARRQAVPGRATIARPRASPGADTNWCTHSAGWTRCCCLTTSSVSSTRRARHRLLGLLPAGQTLVTTASPLPEALIPAAVIDLSECALVSRDEPVPLAEVLDTLAGRLRRVDLRLIDRARELWPSVVDPVLAEHCQRRSSSRTACSS